MNEEDHGAGAEMQAFRQSYEKDANELFSALGEFICIYATTETSWHMCLDRSLYPLNPAISRAMAGGMRLGDLTGVLSRVIAMGDLPDERKREFRECLTHFDHITAFRNRLIHRGATPSYGRFVSSNSLTAKARESVEVLRFSLRDLRAAADDCYRIHVRLMYLWGDNELVLSGSGRQRMYGPWRYKPLQPIKPGAESD